MMCEGYEKAAWNKWSSSLSLLANCHTSKGTRFSPDDFNPYTVKKDEPTISDEALTNIMKRTFGHA